MLTELQSQLERHTIVVTPTTRLAYYLQQTRALSHSIISLQEWLNQLWESYVQQTPMPWKRLSIWQSTVVWEHIIAQYDLPLLRPHAIVTQAQHAWQALQQWQVPFSAITHYLKVYTDNQGNSDSELFARWAQTYANFCRQKQWVDAAQLPHFLSAHIKTSAQRWYLYGFDYLTPQLQQLCKQLREKGAHIDEYKSSCQPRATVSYYQYPDEQSEWRAAALWAQQQVNIQGENQAPIGIVIPDLAQQWQKIQRIFTEMLAPEQLLSATTAHSLPFNIDAGLIFAHYPLIADTLSVLTWIAQPLSYSQISHLLRCIGWPHHAEELTARAQFTVDLATQGCQELSIAAVMHYLSTALSQQPCEFLLTSLSILQAECAQWPHQAMPSHWVELLTSLLVKMTWAQEYAEKSVEYQLWQRWLNALAEIATLDTVLLQPITYLHCLTLIRQHLQHICFQPESAPATIQVMGILETSGMPFSQIWVCGLHAQSWPATPQANPFIPNQLQREYGLPHASAVQELTYAQHFTQQWRCSAQELIVSYAQSSGDSLFQPSPLLMEWVKTIEEKAQVKPPWQQQVIPCSRVEVKEDHVGLPCATAQGSVRLLQDQAACPFRAYAYHRLGLAQHKLTVPTALGNALMRGKVVHRALQLIWITLTNQQQLLNLSATELLSIVNTHIAQALEEHYQVLQKMGKVPAVFLQVEQQRLSALLIRCLEKEKQRQPFTVHRLEHTVTLDLQDITLKMRIDRIDQLAEGTFVILDYKTAKQPTMQFMPERLIHTQLPLYALSKPTALAAVVFAQVAADSIGFSGWVENEYVDSFPKSNTQALTATVFAQQLQEWKQQLDMLAREFKTGYAKVAPYPNKTACRHCDLQLLCRINQ